MRGAVVDDPEDPARGTVRRLVHHLGNQSIKRSVAGRLLAPAEELCPMHIPGRQVRPGTGAIVLVFDAHLTLGAGRSEEHTSELQSRENLVCRLLLEKKK